jgi:hypothetical protein
MIFEVGIRLSQIVWKKLTVDADADSHINELGFKLLQRGDYKIAKSVLGFAHDDRKAQSERTRKMIAINYANALRLSGEDEKSEKILSGIDWSAAGLDFHICVAAVMGKGEDVAKMMKKMGNGGQIDEEDFRQWPVFFHVREQEVFRQAYEEVFLVPYKPTPLKRTTIANYLQYLTAEDTVSQKQTESETVH